MRKLNNPYFEERRPSLYGGLIARILLIAAAVCAVLLAALFYLPGRELLLIWNWIYVAAAALPFLLLLGALAAWLHQRIRSKWPRLIAVWGAVMLTMVAVVVVYSFCTVYATYGSSPAAYYTNRDTGNRLVIMKAADFDSMEGDSEPSAYYYGAFPMRGKFFYYPERGDAVLTKTGVDYVEWIDDGMGAAVHITDVDGAEQVLVVSFDFSSPSGTDAEAETPGS